MSASVKLEGFKELERKLNRMPENLHKKVMRKAVRAGAKPVTKTARSKVPKRTGQLRKSMGVKVKRYGGTFVAIVGPRKGHRIEVDGKMVDPTKYAHLVEFGTQHVGPRAFLRPAFDGNKSTSISEIRKKLREGIEREARRK